MVWVMQPVATPLFQLLVVNQTYIADIKGDPIMVSMVKESLDYFNRLGNNEVIDYEKKFGDYSRPVTIYVKSFTGFWEVGLAGYANIDLDHCIVYVDQDEPDVLEFQKTVIHEYLHCVGYDHVNDRKDVMYKAATPGINSDLSIKHYADEIKGRKWKTLKN